MQTLGGADFKAKLQASKQLFQQWRHGDSVDLYTLCGCFFTRRCCDK